MKINESESFRAICLQSPTANMALLVTFRFGELALQLTKPHQLSGQQSVSKPLTGNRASSPLALGFRPVVRDARGIGVSQDA